jgi:pyridoxal phosphate enzyme (YggS family)
MDTSDALFDRCRENLAAVHARIADACGRAGRSVADVRLVGVTKYVSPDLAALLVRAGCLDLGESRPQSLWEKAESLAAVGASAEPPRWHLIGHLQRNKIRRTLPWLSLLHSLDSPRLLEALQAEAALAGRPCDVLVEVNLSGDPRRTGLPEAEVPAMLEAAAGLSLVRVLGLMGMASQPDASDSNAARREFARLRVLRDVVRRGLPPGSLPELSMGMSGDFEAAIVEGATLVRVGSALWEGLA